MRRFETWVLWLFVLPAVFIYANTLADGIHAECLDNRVQFTIQGSWSARGPLEVYAVNDTQTVLLTPYLAAQCGYTQKFDPWGNTIVSASQQSCFTQNKDDLEFTVVMQFKLYEFPSFSEKVHDVIKSCPLKMMSREILCETNFMQVSVRNAIPDKETASKQWPTVISNLQLWKVILYTPEENSFDEEDILRMGYSLNSSPTRLVMRSPYNMAGNYVQKVADVDMIVLKSLVLYRDLWMMTIVESSAACPINGAAVVGQLISWRVPLHITPLVSSGVEIFEVHMGVNGRRLSYEEMASRNYTMTFTDSHIVVEIPIGAPDGNYKSHVQTECYHISYTIEPMIEILWKEGLDNTTYKVLFPITTPLTYLTPQFTDNTKAELKMFDVLLGYFLPDVQLWNITFGFEVLSVSEVIHRGLILQEHSYPNGTKAFSLQVSFSDPNVQKNLYKLQPDVTTYTLSLVFEFVILPELRSFLHSVVLEASLRDIVLPQAGGKCKQERFEIYVSYGSTQHSNLKITLGESELNNQLLQQYTHHQNDSHLTLNIPLMSPDVVFESVQLAGIVGRLDVKVQDSSNDWHFKDFSLTCPFLVPLLECFSNGTMTVVLPKLESVPTLNPRKLSLRDPACKPFYSDDHVAYFHFALSDCGTSRMFVGDTIKYENEVTLTGDEPLQKLYDSLATHHQQYRIVVSCIYTANATRSAVFQSVSPVEPNADIGLGDLSVQLRLSQDMVYRLFYHNEDFPVLKFLKQPLYFEVGMDHSSDSRIAVVLENCWATLHEDRTSNPRWDLIVDGCANPKDPEQTTLHRVMPDNRVHFPDHFKRFEVKTFAFPDDDNFDDQDATLARRVFIHCDVAICHMEGAADGSCFKQCTAPPNQSVGDSKRVRRRANFTEEKLQHVSIGPILLM
ncbi:zona pellucida protein AX 2 [Triplophysa dalaica]|uniref:zona pellucida protein AX 2 n=1 Tax=Triplophysa dalaica TaxID=1582913 RepID=UPI0024DF4CBA|nr:zona pellucida protein AX 2 [Triplophysa dalaica]